MLAVRFSGCRGVSAAHPLKAPEAFVTEPTSTSSVPLLLERRPGHPFPELLDIFVAGMATPAGAISSSGEPLFDSPLEKGRKGKGRFP
jgi:hypothetical protein